MARTTVIFDDNADQANVTALAEFFNGVSDRTVVASRSEWKGPAESVPLPPDTETEPKARNWIVRNFGGDGGFLHVVSGNVQVLPSAAKFMDDLETMMKVLDYPIWLSTVTDGCNYVYGRYNPRIRVSMNRPECGGLGLSDEIRFTSHSNTQWMAYDVNGVQDANMLLFDERFTVAMYFIIEFLARRKRLSGADSLVFMNQYMTVGSEYGAFKTLPEQETKPGPGQDTLRKEDELFKQICRDYAPDGNIDTVLERLWEKIVSKHSRLSV